MLDYNYVFECLKNKQPWNQFYKRCRFASSKQRNISTSLFFRCAKLKNIVVWECQENSKSC